MPGTWLRAPGTRRTSARTRQPSARNSRSAQRPRKPEPPVTNTTPRAGSTGRERGVGGRQRDARLLFDLGAGGVQPRRDLLADRHRGENGLAAHRRVRAGAHAAVQQRQQFAEARITLLAAEQQAADAREAAPEFLERLAEGFDHDGRRRRAGAGQRDHVAQDEVRRHRAVGAHHAQIGFDRARAQGDDERGHGAAAADHRAHFTVGVDIERGELGRLARLRLERRQQ